MANGFRCIPPKTAQQLKFIKSLKRIKSILENARHKIEPSQYNEQISVLQHHLNRIELNNDF